MSELQDLADRARNWLDSMKTVVSTVQSHKDALDVTPEEGGAK